MLDFNLGVLTPSIICCKDEYPELVYFQDYQNMCELDVLFKEFDDKNNECIGCAMCAKRCPDIAIEVFK